MTCPDIIDLERFVLRDLDAAAATSITAHAAGCQQCATEIDEMRRNLEIAPSLRRDARPSADDDSPEVIPEVIGPYRILRKIGHGGMGAVFEAQQENPRRIVALKIVRPGLVSSKLLARFRHETQVLGRLKHPGIAQIFEAGTHRTDAGQQPYFVMEFVSGAPLIKFADAKQLDVPQRLDLMARVCDAVQHAHQRGVIHRDLKPDNILVDDSSNPAQPKILDFGVARVVDPDGQTTTLHTSVGQIVGTVAYMSPEQANADPAEVDTRADVYALGVICYQLLSGRLPYRLNVTSVAESVRAISEDEPKALATIDRSFRGDVTTIVGKALEKEKSRRYQSAEAMAADIRRHLRDEPITANPPSTIYQLRKFARRNKGLVIGVALAFVILIFGVVGTTIGMVRATRAADTALREADKQSAVNKFLQELLASASPQRLTLDDRAKGRNVTLLEAINAAAKRIDAGALKNQPEIELAVRNTLAIAYHDLGESNESERHVETSLKLARALHGPQNKEVASALFQLASVRDAQGRADEAESLVREALAMNLKLFGTPHDSVAKCLTGLGVLLKGRGKLAEAELLLRQALEMRSKLTGDETMDVAEILNDLALLLKEREEGKLSEAESLHRRSLQIRLKLLGEEHPDVAAALNNLAITVRDQDRFAEAEPIFRRSLEMRRRLLGDDHPDVSLTMNNLASLIQSAGRLDEADEMYRESIKLQRKVHGEAHPALARTINNLATLLYERGNAAEAEPLFRESLEMRRKLLGEDHPMLARGMGNLAAVLRDLGRFDEAEQLAAGAASISARTMGEDHPDTAAYRARRGTCLIELRRFDEAERELLAAHRVLEPRMSSGDTRDVGCIRNLTKLYTAWGKPELASRWQARLPTTRDSTTKPAPTPTRK